MRVIEPPNWERGEFPVPTGNSWTSAGRGELPAGSPRRERPPKGAGKPGGTGRVLAVQCIACTVLILLAVLLRAAGGTAYEALRQSLRQGMLRNDWMAALASFWDGDVSAEASDELERRNEDGAASESTSPESTASASGASLTTVGVGRLPPEGVAPLAVGTLTSPFGYLQNPTGDGGEQFHRGVDIAAPAGTPLRAMFDGRVTEAGTSQSFGNFLRLCPGDGVEILYGHCQSLLVETGTVVRAGETVALVGATGAATGNHVHIQLSRDGIVYNPGKMVPVERYA